MQFGLGRLGLPPETFWRMTIPELTAAASAAFGSASGAAMTLADLRSLMSQFPDQGSD